MWGSLSDLAPTPSTFFPPSLYERGVLLPSPAGSSLLPVRFREMTREFCLVRSRSFGPQPFFLLRLPVALSTLATPTHPAPLSNFCFSEPTRIFFLIAGEVDAPCLDLRRFFFPSSFWDFYNPVLREDPPTFLPSRPRPLSPPSCVFFFSPPNIQSFFFYLSALLLCELPVYQLLMASEKDILSSF